MFSCPPSSSASSTQALCQRTIKSANARPHRRGFAARPYAPGGCGPCEGFGVDWTWHSTVFPRSDLIPVPQGIEGQAEACWRNIIAILADAGMGVGRPGSASIIVKALVMPEWLIEIEAIAAAKA
jgi:hypothetical protein